MIDELLMMLEEAICKILSGCTFIPDRPEEDKKKIKKSILWSIFDPKYETCPKCKYAYSEKKGGIWSCPKCGRVYAYGAPGPS